MVLLVSPNVGRWEKIGIRTPLGLLYIATYLKKYQIHSKIIDPRVSKKWKRELIEGLKEADLVGITCKIGPQVRNALKIARFIKAKKPEVMIVFGGVQATLLPESVLRESCVDVVVRGEGEIPLLELAKKYDLSKIKGISFKKIINSKEEVIHNSDQTVLKPEEIPIPDYTFLDMDKYSSNSFSGEKSSSIQASRGCPYACGFCYNNNNYYKAWRPFAIEKVLENMDILVKEYNIKTFYFVDDNAAIDRNRFLELLKRIKQKSYKVNLVFQGLRIDTLENFSDETFTLLKETGVKGIDIGVETLNEKFLKKVDKHLTSEQILKTLEKIKKYNFNYKFNFISGLPGQTKEDFDYDIQEAKKLLKTHENSYVIFNIWMPFPGTKLYEDALKSGFKPPEKFEGWAIFAGTSWMRKHSWFSKKTIKYLEDISFLFLFANKNILSKVSNKITRTIIKIYQPIASFRLDHRFNCFMIERKLTEFLD